MGKLLQAVLCCPCGDPATVAGLCPTCYTLRRRDEAYFGGLRERVLMRDGRFCRVCAALPEVERLCAGQPPSVHHRVPGVSKLRLMITLCAGHHAIVERLLVADREMPPLLLELWREKHPSAPEQVPIPFHTAEMPGRRPSAESLLFEGFERGRT